MDPNDRYSTNQSCQFVLNPLRHRWP